MSALGAASLSIGPRLARRGWRRPDVRGVDTSGRPRVIPSSRLGMIPPAKVRVVPGGGSGAAALLSGAFSAASHGRVTEAILSSRASYRSRRGLWCSGLARGREPGAARVSGRDSLDPLGALRSARSRVPQRSGNSIHGVSK